MNDAQKTTIERWLDEHWLGQAKCPAGHDGWSVAPNMSFMPGFTVGEGGPKIVHESGFTFVVLTCTTCGYVALLDTSTIGLGPSA